MKPGLSLILIAVAGASLTACGRQNGDDVPEADAFATTAGRNNVEDQFGKEFGKAYRADPNSEPVVVTEGAVPPVSLTSEPVPIE